MSDRVRLGAARYFARAESFGGKTVVPRSRLSIVCAEEDAPHRDAAIAALSAFDLTVAPLRTGGTLDAAAPAVLVWTFHASRREDIARAMLAPVAHVVLWRPDGTPAPMWLSQSYPVGPEMPLKALALLARLAVADGARRGGGASQQTAPSQLATSPPWRRRLVAGLACALLVGAAGVLFAVQRDYKPAPTAVAGLRGTQ